MIGQFYPFPITGSPTVGATFNVVNVRATTSATELANDIEWIVTQN